MPVMNATFPFVEDGEAGDLGSVFASVISKTHEIMQNNSGSETSITRQLLDMQFCFKRVAGYEVEFGRKFV